MVWLTKPASDTVRLGVYMTTVEMKVGVSRVAEFDVYYKPSELNYIAFIAREPIRSADLCWMDFVEMTNAVAAREGSGPNPVDPESWCTAMEAGSEIWAGISEGQVSRFDVAVMPREAVQEKDQVCFASSRVLHTIGDLYAQRADIDKQIAAAYHELAQPTTDTES